MIPTPKLDDRTYADIIAEAVRLIPRYCPEWTDHNVSDPGVTLIELFAWMVEGMLYQLNRVPEKTYITLLELLGERCADHRVPLFWYDCGCVELSAPLGRCQSLENSYEIFDR